MSIRQWRKGAKKTTNSLELIDTIEFSIRKNGPESEDYAACFMN